MKRTIENCTVAARVYNRDDMNKIRGRQMC